MNGVSFWRWAFDTVNGRTTLGPTEAGYHLFDDTLGHWVAMAKNRLLGLMTPYSRKKLAKPPTSLPRERRRWPYYFGFHGNTSRFAQFLLAGTGGKFGPDVEHVCDVELSYPRTFYRARRFPAVPGCIFRCTQRRYFTLKPTSDA